MPVAWDQCPDCDEHYCNVHGEHVADCSCPEIGVWIDAGMSPYSAMVTPALRAWVQANPYEDSDEPTMH